MRAAVDPADAEPPIYEIAEVLEAVQGETGDAGQLLH